MRTPERTGTRRRAAVASLALTLTLAVGGSAAARQFEATGSPVITDGEQAKPSFATYPIHGLPNVPRIEGPALSARKLGCWGSPAMAADGASPQSTSWPGHLSA